MGAVQQPTPAMDVYRVEIRRESFYLDTVEPADRAEVEQDDDHTLRVPAAHATHLVAALDQVIAHGDWARWRQHGAPEQAGVVVTRDGDHLLLSLPNKLYAEKRGGDADGRWLTHTEIEYRHVRALRDALAAAVGIALADRDTHG